MVEGRVGAGGHCLLCFLLSLGSSFGLLSDKDSHAYVPYTSNQNVPIMNAHSIEALSAKGQDCISAILRYPFDHCQAVDFLLFVLLSGC